ncbi:MAG: DNA-directed RNA polymerase subunit alpha [Fimbriimonas sp.]|jgi:DNA-directed RNA polymerase subunit alpha|nr:DNA-directed RNA polymerase subunit alpha [Fimbriimonadaceae bacterium]MCE2767610.1 DNA-directed RNA polymerase subunit alpha [Fimbriimonadaceae bacterium]
MPAISSLQLTNDYGKFVLEPLERGYGQTLGNTLRRILLSSIQGAAISAIRIDKVFHEFAPIPGVKEDTTQLILNLKSIAVKVLGEEPIDEVVLRIEATGPGRVTGADIVCPENIEIVNPEAYIATLSDAKAHLNMELFVNWGVGYTMPDKQDRYRGVIGLLPVGAQYTPIRKTNYVVEATRVGTRTDYERLVIEIETNGTIAPNDALSQSAQIMIAHLRLITEVGAAGFTVEIGTEEQSTDEILKNVPDIKIEELDFSQRTFNCLRRAGILNLRALALVTEADLTAIRGFGKKSLLEVRDKLAEHGLEMKPSKGGYRSIDLLDDDEDDF